MWRTGAANLVLRGLTLGGKSVLLVVLARYLPPSEVGVFGLMTVTLAIGVLVLGLDFYTYNTREILAVEGRNHLPFVRNQLVFHGLVYAVALPLLGIVFLTGTLPWHVAGWFFVLVVLEHLAQEAFRLLTTLSRPVAASLVLFLRSGLWAYLAALAVVLYAPLRSLSFVWGCWVASVTVALILAGRLVWMRAGDGGRWEKVDWPWVRRGIKTCLPFFSATLALMGVQYADRYFLEHFHGTAAVGVYTFFAGIANVVQVFVFSAVTMVLYPKVVSAFQQGRLAAYRCELRRMAVGTLVGTLAVALVLALAVGPLLAVVGRETYTSRLPVFWMLLAAMTLMAWSYVPHFALYARHRDRAIIGATFAALAVSLTLNALLVPGLGLIGAAWATAGATGCLFAAKLLCAWLAGRSERKAFEEVRPAPGETLDELAAPLPGREVSV